MADRSKIEWTDATWNPLRARRLDTGHVGYHCERVSPGCANCYAAVHNGRCLPGGGTGLNYTRSNRDRVTTFVDRDVLLKPLKWKRPRRIFVGSMTDLFGEWVTDEQIDQVFAVMNACSLTLPASPLTTRWHTFQVLTKRAERMQDYMRSRRFENWNRGNHPIFSAGRGDGGVLRGCGFEVMNAAACLSWPPPNVWLGVSAEDQATYDWRIGLLRDTPAAVRFVSAEPLLGLVDLHSARCRDMGSCPACPMCSAWLDWVITGGESGCGARPCNSLWLRSIVRQCAADRVACFVKQLGGEPILDWGSGSLVDRKGGDELEWPVELRVRQWPEVSYV